MLELNRNQWFLFGLIVLLLGFQLRYVKTFVLNERATTFIHQQMKNVEMAASDQTTAMAVSTRLSSGPYPFTPPRWIGYMLLSVGTVVVLYTLAVKKPAG